MQCIYRDLNAQCQNCAKRSPPVECVRTGSRAPQELQVTVFHLGKQIGCETKNPKTRTPTSGNALVGQQSSRRSSGDIYDDHDTDETQEQPQQSEFTLAIRPKKPSILDGRRDGSVNTPSWGHLGGILTEVGTNINTFALEMTLENAELLHYCKSGHLPDYTKADLQRPITGVAS